MAAELAPLARQPKNSIQLQLRSCSLASPGVLRGRGGRRGRRVDDFSVEYLLAHQLARARSVKGDLNAFIFRGRLSRLRFPAE
jgi:hypothetical protein